MSSTDPSRFNCRYNGVVLISVRALAAGLVCSGLLLTSCKENQPAPESKVKSDSTRKAAPEFALKDADGKTVTLADYKGKVVLLNFWATWS
jgi:cytochrome oxidase Cu insertion factor (SCO1/SenC/PrrC family)